MNYETVIGLEIHAQLLTDSKMFCSCSTKFGNDPNSNICPVCTGQPGSLPVINKKAVELAVKTALALNCTVNLESIFARKNYFYPDLPKGYQISQFERPLAEKGYLDITVNGVTKRVGITRVHLEEDAGKLVHKGSSGIKGADYSLVDLNRTGTPLMEIVSEPDIRSSEEAKAYMEMLALILQHLEVCDAKLEEGSLRCDANISIRKEGETKLGVKSEVKNLNSFKSVQKALEIERSRQTEVLSEGGSIRQETLLYDESTGELHSMRSKEQSHDYRYFPDPDLLPLEVKKEDIENIKTQIPELPREKASRFTEKYKLNDYDANILACTKGIADYFEETVKILEEPKLIANWIIGDVFAYLKSSDKTICDIALTPKYLAELIGAVKSGRISGKTAKEVFTKVIESGKSPKEIIDSSGATQISDEAELVQIITKSVDENPQSVEAFKKGKDAAIKFLIGSVMKQTKGRANPAVAERLLREELGKR